MPGRVFLRRGAQRSALVLERAADAAGMLLADGLAAAQNTVHAGAAPGGPGP
jgi:hypothetical protein